MLENIYIASNMASLLDSCKLILGREQKINRPKLIENTGLKARLFYRIEVNTQGPKPQDCCILHQSGSKTSLLARISQSSQCKVIVETIDPSLANFVIHIPFVCRKMLQFDGMQDNLGRQSSAKGCRDS